jgi:hypothetical protein
MAQGLTTPGVGARTTTPRKITELSIIYFTANHINTVQMQNLWI